MKFAVDKIEDNVVVLENIDTKEIIAILKKDLDFEVKESDILVFIDNKYFKDDKEKENRLKIIQEKFNKVKK